jgi:hypothetical protein
MQIAARVVGFLMCVQLLSAPASAETGQKIYDRAEAALAKGDAATAVTLFAGLATKMQKSTSLSKYELLARYGDALLLNSDFDEAAIVLDQAHSGFKTLNVNPDIINAALEQLALAQFNSFDYGPAAQNYATLVEQLKSNWPQMPMNKRRALLLSLALATFWSGTANAEFHLDALLAEASAEDKKPQEFRSYVNALKARFALTQGDTPGAGKHIRKAMQLAGGITERTSIVDRIVRQDAALVAWFRKERQEFFRYTAMSGAARLGETDKLDGNKKWLEYFSNRVNGSMPLCPTLSDVTPQDVVVIEFAIGNQGQPVRLQPIYSSNWSKIEKPFLQTVRSWSFNDTMAELNPFWRESYRLALRCQTARNDRPSALMIPESIRALIEMQSVALELPADAVDLIDQPKIFAKVFTAYQSKKAENPDDPALGPLIFMLSKRNAAQSEKSKIYLEELAQLQQKHPSLLPLFNFASIYTQETPKGLEALLNNLALTAMPDVQAYGFAKLGLMYENAKDKKAAEVAYQAVMDSKIAAQSPYRLMAMLHLASIVQKNQPEKATELFKATGLQPE